MNAHAPYWYEERMMREPDWWMPKAWPLFWRRAFVVTLPISGPIWAALWIVGHFVVMAVCVCVSPFIIAKLIFDELWPRQIGDR